MKKTLSLILCMLFTLAIFLTGCGIVLTNITNEEKGIIYNGGSVAKVGDYIFFANGFQSDYASMADLNAYHTATKHAQLSRVKLDDLSDATTYANCENVEVVSGGDLAGFTKAYMFAYGQNVYYVCPNTHKTNENKQAFDHLSVFRVGFDGKGRKELYTTEQAFDATNGKIVALEYNNVAYIMIYDGANLVTIDITNGGTKADLDNVTSVAFPQEGASWNGKVYFTMDKEAEDTTKGNNVFEIKVDGTGKEQINNNGELSDTVKFIGRIDDQVFYTLTGSATHTYYASATDIDANLFASAGDVYYYKEISLIQKINAGESYTSHAGFLFTSNSTVMYQSTASDDEPVVLIDSATHSNARVICSVGAYVYFSTAKGIYRVSVASLEVEPIIEEMTITTDIAGYTINSVDGDAEVEGIYFYAQREYDPEAEAEETEEEKTEDTKVYLYQVSAKGGKAKLVGKTYEE